jgi:hypothetical protein
MQKPDFKGREDNNEKGAGRKEPTVSTCLPDGTLVELLYQPDKEKTLFVIGRDGELRESEEVSLSDGRILVPYSPRNNLITHRAILLPSEAAEYKSETLLRALVQSFIHRYVDLPADFEEVAAHYVFLSWRFDDFTDLPYLRVLGDYGSGKSRFLKTVGAVAYRPIFASGASTVSPLFRILDSVGGTLILDEADFRFSDEKADIVKILNNGNSTGFPVLRTETTPRGEFNPKAFKVFGPKLIATRGHFDDPALESRCITCHLGGGKMRSDIPVNLPPEFEREALAIRNQLLRYRLEAREAMQGAESLRTLEPRIAQVFSSLLASVEDSKARERLLSFAREASANVLRMRSDSIEADVVARALELWEALPGAVPVKMIARDVEGERGLPLSPRAVGAILRRLGLSPRKRQGNYILPAEEVGRLTFLAKRYGILSRGDLVDVVDVVDKKKEGGNMGAE